MTGGEITVGCLERAGVEYVFGLCGHTVLGVLDALIESPIEYVSFRHEQLAAHAADGYFRVTHKPGVVMTHLGPGFTNAVTGVANAALDSSALLVIAGDIPSTHFGRDAHQEVKMHGDATQFRIYEPFVKRAWRVHRIEALPRILERAFALAVSGRPGPVLVDVPMDFFSMRAELELPAMKAAQEGPQRFRGDKKDLEKAAALLSSAERPLIYAGGGVILSQAWEELTALAERLEAPVAYSLMGKGAISDGHPLCLGMSGFWGTPLANRKIKEADLILALGTRFGEASSSSWLPQYTFNIPPTKLIQVDLDPAEMGKNYPLELGIMGDAGSVLADLLELLGGVAKPAPESPVRAEIAREKETWRAGLDELGSSPAKPIRPERILKEIREALPEDGIVTTDVGWNKNGLAQQFPVTRPMTHLAPSGLATMGFGPAAVIGAKLGAGERKAVAVIGDGAMSSVIGILATAKERNLDVVWVVMNNHAYGVIQQLQQAAFGRDTGTRFECPPEGSAYNPDFAAVARAYGIRGFSITEPGDLKPALEEALSGEGPCLLDVVMDGRIGVPTDGYWDILDIYKL